MTFNKPGTTGQVCFMGGKTLSREWVILEREWTRTDSIGTVGRLVGRM